MVIRFDTLTHTQNNHYHYVKVWNGDVSFIQILSIFFYLGCIKIVEIFGWQFYFLHLSRI